MHSIVMRVSVGLSMYVSMFFHSYISEIIRLLLGPLPDVLYTLDFMDGIMFSLVIILLSWRNKDEYYVRLLVCR